MGKPSLEGEQSNSDDHDDQKSQSKFQKSRVPFNKVIRKSGPYYKSDGVNRRRNFYGNGPHMNGGPIRDGHNFKPRWNNQRGDQSRARYFYDNPTDITKRKHVLQSSQSNWYRVLIMDVKKFSKEFLIEKLLSFISPVTFTPIMYHTTETDAIFYVEDYAVASKISKCNRKIITAGDFQIKIRVRPGTPYVQIDDKLKEKLKIALEKRYTQETDALNLSRFHNDDDLAVDYWCPLNNTTMFAAILELQNLPNLTALNLDSNSLKTLKNLAMYSDKLPNLKILHLGNNWIRYMDILDDIKNFQLEELKLEGNPVCNRYGKFREYANDIRKRFPKLLVLDGQEMPPPILFDVKDEKRELPTVQKLFIVQAEVQDFADQFLQQYFTIFDSENRQSHLPDAYHEDACLSMTTTVPRSSENFASYLKDNRNLIRVSNSSQRVKLMKLGKEAVASFFSEFPRTKHDFLSFTVDLILATEEMVVITVTGCFKEICPDENEEVVRYFDRTFTVVPEGTGFCISNEQLHISNPTFSQERKYNSMSANDQPVAESSLDVSLTGDGTDEIKQEMAVSLSKQTNMNIEWSCKCLEDMQWNLEEALAAFQEAFNSGKIPSDAFVK